MDYGTKRISVGASGNDIVIGGTEPPEDEDAKIWFPDNAVNTKASEVIDSMKGNETDLAPSVNAVKSYIDEKTTYSTDEIEIGKWIDGKPLYRKIYEIALGSSTSITPHNLGSECYFVGLDGIATNGVSVFKLNQYRGGAEQYECEFLITNERTIWINPKGDRTGYTAYVTLEYTKTTDKGGEK